jgi:hypothetical protein
LSPARIVTIESLGTNARVSSSIPRDPRGLFDIVSRGCFSTLLGALESAVILVSAADVTESGGGALAKRRITFPPASRNSSRALSEAGPELLSQ